MSFLVVRVGAGLSTGLEYAPFPPVCPVCTSTGRASPSPRCVVGLLRGASRDGVLRSPPAPSSPAVPVVDLHQRRAGQRVTVLCRDRMERLIDPVGSAVAVVLR